MLQMRNEQRFIKNRPERVDQLINLGYPLDRHEGPNDPGRRWETILTALQTYKATHGDLDVPRHFVVPSEDPAWPAMTWGVLLGKRVTAIRSQSTFVASSPERR